MKSLYLIILLMSILGMMHAGAWNWATNIGNTGMERAWDLATDPAGNYIWAGGEFSESLTLNGITYPAVGLSDAFVAKYDNSGNLQWFRSLGSPEEDICLSLAVDAAGNCYITGFYVGTLQFNSQQLPSAGLWDIFVGKYAPDGNLLWLKRFGGPLNDIGYGISVDPAGNAYLTGWFASGFDLGEDVSLQSYGGSDMFVFKLDTDGNPLWARHGGSEGVEYGYKIDVASDGTCFATGVAGPECSFNGMSPVYDGLFIACYDASGQIQWLSSALNGGPINIGVGPGTDSTLRGMVTGRVTGTAIIGDTVLSSNEGSDDIFCAEFDPTNGSWINTRHWGGTGSDKGRAVDIRGTALMAASYENGTIFDGIPMSSFGAWDMIVVGENGYPQPLGFGGTENDVLADVKWLSDQTYAVCGWYMGSVRFGNQMLSSSSSTDQNAFVAVYDIGGSSAEDHNIPASSPLTCYPNPFSSAVSISSNRADTCAMHVYDIRGRRINTLTPGYSAASRESVWTWDGRAKNGARCASGIYFFLSEDGKLSTKVIYICPK